MARRGNPSELESMLVGYEHMIREAMARHLWVVALADYVEDDASQDDPTVERLRRMARGADWYDIAPETPEAASKAADDLAALFAIHPGKTPMALLLELMMHIDGHTSFGFVGGDRPEDRPDNDYAIRITREFGDGMAAAADDAGDSWFAEHKRPDGFPKVSFRCTYDGNDLEWSGSVEGKWQKTGKGSSFMGAKLRGRIGVVNADENTLHNRSYLIAFGAGILSFPMLLLVYADDFHDALELCVPYLADRAPGLLDDNGELDPQSYYTVAIDPDHDEIVRYGSSQGVPPRFRAAVPTIEVYDNRDQVVETWQPDEATADAAYTVVAPAAQFLLDHSPLVADGRTFAPGTFYMSVGVAGGRGGVHDPDNRIFRLRNFSAHQERAIFEEVVPAMMRARTARARAPERRPHPAASARRGRGGRVPR